MKQQKNIIIIGAGFGGITAAALLAKEGHKVTVLEKNDRPGGRARIWENKGFRFDMGPSWYLVPDIFEDFLAKFGKKPQDYYELVRLEPAYRMFFGSDDIIDITSDLTATMNLFDDLEQDGAHKLQKYLDKAKLQYDISVDNILYEDMTSFLQFFRWDLMKNGLRLDIFQSLEKKVNKSFQNDRLRKILLYSAVFLGANPAKTPAIYSLMSHVDFNLGVWYPKGGIGKVVSSLVELAEEQGATFLYNQEVQHVKVIDGEASVVITTDNEYSPDIVVVNADYHHAETQFFDLQHQQYPEKYWSKKTIAPSGFIIYLGLSKQISKLRHHTLVLDNDWMRHFEAIFDNPDWPEFPSYYVCVPSKTDSSVAPEGKENLFILVPVASDLKDTDEVREQYATKIISHLENLLGESIQDAIEVKRVFSHRDFSSDYNAYKGTALGLSHTLFQSVMFRPRHRSKKVKNVYYTGQYTHPGIGVPMTFMSSTIMGELIKKHYE